MNTTKRIFAFLLIVVMLASMLCVGAGAVDITINGPEGVTYNVYQVFEIAERDGDAVLYKWATGTTTDQKTALDAYVAEKKGYVSLKTDSLSFAKAVLDSGKYTTPTDFVKISASDKTVDLEDGYYVMADDATPAISAFSVIGGKIISSGGTEISPKAALPTIEKSVADPDGIVSADDTLVYTIVVTADEMATNYKVVDTPIGVAGINSVTIDADEPITVTDYDVTVATGGTALTVVFKANYLAKLDANDKITITYNAKLSDACSTGTTANTNTAVLTYGPYNLTKEATANVYTGEIKFKKIYNEGTPSSDAIFVIKKSDTEYAKIVSDVFAGWVAKADATPITAVKDTDIAIKGFDLGTYTLVETDAPTGYIYADPVTVTIEAASPGVANPALKTIENIMGNKLPETGGMGTTVFYAAGGILVLGALVVLLMKKRTVTE